MNVQEYGQEPIDCLLEFLQAAFHEILFLRGPYAPELFDRVRLYNVPLHECRSPDVFKYIEEVLGSMKDWFMKKKVDRVALQICTESGSPYERYCFDIEAEMNKLASSSNPIKLQQAFKMFILKISQSENQFPWIDAQEQEVVFDGEKSIIPLRSMAQQDIRMQLFVEKPEREEGHR